MYYLVTDSRYTGPDNLAILQSTDTDVLHYDWSDSLLDSLNAPNPQFCEQSLEEILADPDCCADTILLSFSNLNELALTHPEFLI